MTAQRTKSDSRLERENARLEQENAELRRALAEALEQQTATGEVLQIISKSPTDLQLVLETIIESGARLCEAHNGAIFTFDGEAFRLAVPHNVAPEFCAYLENNPPRPGRGTPLRQAGLEQRTVHILDVLAEPELGAAESHYRREGMRTALAVPLLKDGRLVGAITMHRQEVRAFGERQIALLEPFADQAVIAIENTRLFRELETRNRDLA